MRIIAGFLKGRIIKVPKSKLVRPTTDKTKESIFNYLNNRIDFDSILMCDLYAGSGSLGLETISRGAEKVHFVEQNYLIYKNLLNTIESFKIEPYAKVYKTSCVNFTKRKEHEKYNLIIADPPFFRNDIYIVVENLLINNYLEKNGILIIERSVQTEKEDIIGFNLEPFKKLGDSLIYKFENN